METYYQPKDLPKFAEISEGAPELAEKFFPGVPITRELDEHEALFSNRKIREVLGFKERHDWRNYVKPD